jgi:hypothetical protein
LAAARVVEKEEREGNKGSGGRIGIHVSHSDQMCEIES